MKRVARVIAPMILCGCQPTLIAEFEDRPVVCCYLDAGTTAVVSVSKLIAFRDDVEYSTENVNDLSIFITDESSGDVYRMNPAGDGKYENPSLVVEEGRTYSLDFIYNGREVHSVATIPEAPQGVSFSAGSIGVMVFDFSARTSTRAEPGGGIEITWDNPDGNYYIVEGMTRSIDPIRESDSIASKSFKLDYTQGSSVTLSSSQFSYLGNYEVSLIRILPEYVAMSQGSGSTSSSLTEVGGNIEGGYGIFTGINRVTKTINVYKQTSPF